MHSMLPLQAQNNLLHVHDTSHQPFFTDYMNLHYLDQRSRPTQTSPTPTLLPPPLMLPPPPAPFTRAICDTRTRTGASRATYRARSSILYSRTSWPRTRCAPSCDAPFTDAGRDGTPHTTLLRHMVPTPVEPLLGLIADSAVAVTPKGHAAWVIAFMQEDAAESLLTYLENSRKMRSSIPHRQTHALDQRHRQHGRCVNGAVDRQCD